MVPGGQGVHVNAAEARKKPAGHWTGSHGFSSGIQVVPGGHGTQPLLLLQPVPLGQTLQVNTVMDAPKASVLNEGIATDPGAHVQVALPKELVLLAGHVRHALPPDS